MIALSAEVKQMAILPKEPTASELDRVRIFADLRRDQKSPRTVLIVLGILCRMVYIMWNERELKHTIWEGLERPGGER